MTIAVSTALVQYLQSHNLPIPPPQSGLALVDTGATLCSIDEAAVRALGIPPFGVTSTHTAGGTVQQNTYPASLSFPGTTLPNIEFADFVGAPLAAGGIIALIGRSLLQHFVLVYNGPSGSISLAY